MNYLTLEEVIDIHELTIEVHGGSSAILSVGLVESAVEQARQTFGGEPLYKSISEVAAAYWHSISSNHGFADGNKRTAALATAFFLRKNGYVLAMDDDEIIATGLAMAGQGMTRVEVFELVAKSVKRL
ncbi:MAG: type II toxin-antitoxin system death-on-curing family toxin [Fimbriimonadaceae bacterium]